MKPKHLKDIIENGPFPHSYFTGFSFSKNRDTFEQTSLFTKFCLRLSARSKSHLIPIWFHSSNPSNSRFHVHAFLLSELPQNRKLVISCWKQKTNRTKNIWSKVAHPGHQVDGFKNSIQKIGTSPVYRSLGRIDFREYDQNLNGFSYVIDHHLQSISSKVFCPNRKSSCKNGNCKFHTTFNALDLWLDEEHIVI